MSTTFTPADVAAFEHATWSRCAPGYHDGFERLTSEAVEPLLTAAGVGDGTRVLDVGTGVGTAAVAALDRGAAVVGIDFSDAMLEQARRAAPSIDFRSASADALPFGNGTFDAVVANGVLHHLADPARSLVEAHRVLAPGGRVACTVWDAPERLEAFGLYFVAVEQHVGAADLPHGPLFGVTDEDVLAGLFEHAGFTDVRIETVPTTWRMPSIDTLLRAFGSWAQIDAFPADGRTAIEETVRSGASAYAAGDGLAIPNPMLLIRGVRAS